MLQSNSNTGVTVDIDALNQTLLAQFRAAAELMRGKPVDLTAMAALPLNDAAKKLTASFVFSQHSTPGVLNFRMQIMKGKKEFGSIGADMTVKNGKIQLNNMVYKPPIVNQTALKGFAPYAVRHFVSAFRNIHELIVSTGRMADMKVINDISDVARRERVKDTEHGKLRFFDQMGFRLFDMKANERFPLPASKDDLQACRAVFDFEDSDARSAVFTALEMSPDSNASSGAALPSRSAFQPRQQTEPSAVIGS